MYHVPYRVFYRPIYFQRHLDGLKLSQVEIPEMEVIVVGAEIGNKILRDLKKVNFPKVLPLEIF